MFIHQSELEVSGLILNIQTPPILTHNQRILSRFLFSVCDLILVTVITVLTCLYTYHTLCRNSMFQALSTLDVKYNSSIFTSLSFHIQGCLRVCELFRIFLYFCIILTKNIRLIRNTGSFSSKNK